MPICAKISSLGAELSAALAAVTCVVGNLNFWLIGFVRDGALIFDTNQSSFHHGVRERREPDGF
jgi:hypothetical protein